MVPADIGNPVERFAVGSVALLLGALGVQYAKWLESGTRRHPRTEPNPYHAVVRTIAAFIFLGGIFFIITSGWALLTQGRPGR